MWVHEHLSIEISEYVLDLLSPSERQRVERHLARCADCRLALQEERGLMQDVRKAMLAATRPSPVRLRHLMPPPPTGKRRTRFEVILRPALAFSILLVLFAASLQIYAPGTHGAIPPTTTAVAVTATTTPTATVPLELERTVVGSKAAKFTAGSVPPGTPVAGILVDGTQRDS